MDESRERWLSYLEMDDCNLFSHMHSLVEAFKGEKSIPSEPYWKAHPSDANLTEESTTLLSNNMFNSSPSEENMGNTSFKQHASPNKPIFQSSTSYTLSFEDTTAVSHIPKKTCQYHSEHPKETQQEPDNNRKSKRGRSSSHVQDHIMNERKRRENITRMFIALSAIIPGLKKMDKISILKSAIDYMKYLEKSVKDLEDRSKKRKIESPLCFKISKWTNVSDDFSCTRDGLDRPTPIKIFPKVEARVSAKDVLIKVMCKKQKDIVSMLLPKLEALNLSITCINVLPFGNSTLNNITIIAQMDHEFSLTMDDLVKILTQDLLECYGIKQ